MDFARQQRDPTKHMVGIAFVVVLHVLVIYALLTGLGKTIVEVIKKPLTATIIDEIKAPPPPPPPPRKIVEVPKVQPQPQPYVPPPDIPMPTTQAEPVISAVTPTPPPEPVVIAPPPVVVAPPPPPPPPPKPAIRRGALLVRVSGEAPTYPREASRAGVEKGRVVARLLINEKGIVTEVQIITSEPSGVFDRAVRNALQDWKFKPDGDKYVGEVEVNFTLKD